MVLNPALTQKVEVQTLLNLLDTEDGDNSLSRNVGKHDVTSQKTRILGLS